MKFFFDSSSGGRGIHLPRMPCRGADGAFRSAPAFSRHSLDNGSKGNENIYFLRTIFEIPKVNTKLTLKEVVIRL